MKFEIGSEWRKWDLHVHTPESKLNNQFGGDWDAYVKTIFKKAIEQEIAVIGITDYFTIEGYKKIVTQYLNKESKLIELFKNELKIDTNYISKIKNILLLPNIEFRLDNIISSKKDGQQPRRLNYHVIFSNRFGNKTIEETIQEIEENFLHNIDFTYEANPQDGFGKRKLKVYNLIELGKKLKAEHTPFNERSDFEIGCMNAVVQINQIDEILKKDNPTLFKDNYIMILAEEYMGLIDWNGQDHNVRKTVTSVSDIIFSSNDKTMVWALTDDFKKEFGSKKPCLCGSDAHSFDQLFIHEGDKICWIKADPTFEGLRQILHEPKDRVFIGKIPEKLKIVDQNKSHFIKNIRITKNHDSKMLDPWFNNDIDINTGLVAIIGNKGSGKSALADIIGFMGDSKNENEFSFLHKNRFRKSPPNLANNFAAEIIWHDGTSNRKGLADKTEITSIERIRYLPQQFIENICNNLDNDFGDEINKMVFSYLPENERVGKNSFNDLINHLCSGIDDKVKTLKNKINNANKKILELEKKELPSYKETINNLIKLKIAELRNHIDNPPKEVIKPNEPENINQKTEIEEIKNKIEELESEIKKKTGDLNTVTKQISELEIIQVKLSDLKNKFTELRKDIDSVFKLNKIDLDLKMEFSYDEERINKELEKLKIEKDKLTNLLEKDNKKQTEDSLYKILNQALETKKVLDNKLNEPLRLHQKYLEDLKEWKTKKEELFGNNEKVDSLLYLHKELQFISFRLQQGKLDEVKLRDALCQEMFDLKLEKSEKYKIIYKSVMDFVNTHKTQNDDDFNFSVEISLKKNFDDQFLNYINQKIISPFKGSSDGREYLKGIINRYEFNKKDDTLSFVNSIYTDITTDKDKFDKLVNNRLECYNYLYSLDYLDIEYRLKLGDKSLEQLSPGEKGSLLLIFYLVLDRDNCPLIIDQPEDNLDNQSVFEKLVPYIRDAKNKRQVIIVTHNPNIAVACDAEQIIFSEIDKENGYKVTYQTGSIENININKHIVDVLEGTMPAFDLRKIKYFGDRIDYSQNMEFKTNIVELSNKGKTSKVVTDTKKESAATEE